jgi:hypothetical protein
MKIVDNRDWPDSCPFYWGEPMVECENCIKCFKVIIHGEYHTCETYTRRCRCEVGTKQKKKTL